MIDLVEHFESIAKELDWGFDYGIDADQNLNDYPHEHDSIPFERRKKYLALISISESDQLNDYSAVESIDYSGTVCLYVSSKFQQEKYLTIYKERLKHLKALVEILRTQLIGCNELTLSRWNKTEVICVYDDALDGIKIDFTLNIKNLD